MAWLLALALGAAEPFADADALHAARELVRAGDAVSLRRLVTEFPGCAQVPAHSRADWLAVAAQAGVRLDSAAAASWATTLKPWLASDLDGVPLTTVRDLCCVLAQQGESTAAAAALASALPAQADAAAWTPELAMDALVLLQQAVPGRVPALRSVAAALHRQVLGDVLAVRCAGLGPWAPVVKELAPDLDPDSGRDWAGRLRAAFAANDAMLAALPGSEVIVLAELLASLDRAQCRQVQARWHALGPVAQASPAEAARIAALACEREPFSTLGREELPLLPDQIIAWSQSWHRGRLPFRGRTWSSMVSVRASNDSRL